MTGLKRQWRFLTATIAVVCLAGIPALAADAGAPADDAPPPARQRQGARAQGEKGRRAGGQRAPGGPMQMLFKDITLTEGQEEQIRAIIKADFESRREQRQARRGQGPDQGPEAAEQPGTESAPGPAKAGRRQGGPQGRRGNGQQGPQGQQARRGDGQGMHADQRKQAMEELAAKLRAVLTAEQQKQFDVNLEAMKAAVHERAMSRGPAAQMFKDITLTDEQKAKVKAVHQEALKARRAFMEAHEEELKALRQQMQTAREAKDREAMKAAGEKIKAVMDQAPRLTDELAKVRAILTAEQQVQFDKNVEAMKDGWQNRRGQGDGAGEGPGRRPRRGGNGNGPGGNGQGPAGAAE